MVPLRCRCAWLTRSSTSRGRPAAPLEEQGWLTVEPAGPRTKVVRLGALGRRSSDAWAAHVPEAERAWRARVGPAEVDRLRSALETVVGAVDLELPHHPITYGSADLRATGGRAVAGAPRIPRTAWQRCSPGPCPARPRR